MAEQVGEIYVSLGVDIEALEQGFTTAQRLSMDAAGTVGSTWEARAAAGKKEAPGRKRRGK